MRIFIGCSTSHLCGINKNGKPRKIDSHLIKNSLANSLLINLEKNGHTVEAWWKQETIRDGEDFFQKIFELSKNCDTGIFILNNEQEVKVNDEYNYLTNDNVLLELGMFISQKGIHNVIFIADSEVKIPSDFSAINVKKYDLPFFDASLMGKSIKYRLNVKNYEFYDTNSKILDLNQKISSLTLDRIHSIQNDFPTDYINATVYFNYDTMAKILNKPEETQLWNSKAAYIGLQAAKTWAKIELDPDYLPEDFKYDFRRFLSSVEVQNSLINIRNIISLGSGIGTLDEQVLRMIQYNGSIKYIPVEINPYLAIQALHRGVRSIINLKSTYSIIDDFESETSQLHDFIKSKIVRTEEESLYTLLGGTFCNLDNQHSFLVDWSKIVDNNDKFLMDAIIKNPSYDDWKEMKRDKWFSKIINKDKFEENNITADDAKVYNRDDDLDDRIKSEFVKPILDNAIKLKADSSALFSKDKRVKKYISLPKNQRLKKMYNKDNPFVKIDIKETPNKSTVFIYKFNFTNSDSNSDNISCVFKGKRHNVKNLYKKIEKHFSIKHVYLTSISDNISRAYFLLEKLKNPD